LLPIKKIDTLEVFTGKCKILIIDDSNEIHQLVRISLKKFPNLTLVHCHDPKLAEALIIDEKPNLVLLDIQMPGVSGDELFIRFQMRNLLKDTIVVFLTALDTTEDIKRLSALGPRGILKKPFSPKLLAQQINDILGAKVS
jgi:DNA-binding response OmpR family regulator